MAGKDTASLALQLLGIKHARQMHTYISIADLPHRRVRVPPFVPKAFAQMMQSCASFSWAAMVSPEETRDQHNIRLDSCDNSGG